MARAISPQISELFLKAHESWGVKFHFSQAVESDHRRKRKGNRSGKGRTAEVLPADLVRFGIGVIPNI